MKYLISLVIAATSLLAFAYVHAQTATFTNGETVSATANLRVRFTPNGRSVGTVHRGTEGTIVAGPINTSRYTWWDIDYANGIDGWSAGNYLRAAVATSTPTTTPPPTTTTTTTSSPPTSTTTTTTTITTTSTPTPPTTTTTTPTPPTATPISSSLSFSSLNCPIAPISWSQAFYVNPSATTNGNGSQASPWNSLSTVLSSEVGGSGPVQAGDVIYLMTGSYGDVVITNINSGFIGLEAAPGQTPLLHTLDVSGASYWYIHGLKIQTGIETTPYTFIVHISPASQTDPVTNIVFDDNSVSTVDSTQGWTTTQWLDDAAQGIDTDMYGFTGTGCISVINNNISNVLTGVNLGSDDTLFQGNTINDFGDDALDFTGYNNQFMIDNTFTNSNTLGDGNHNDFFQGFTAGDRPTLTHNNVLIEGNTVIRQTGPTGNAGITAFPGDIQGIDIFDDTWNNVQVLNNTVITSAYWGIGFDPTVSGIIEDNTVLDDGSNASGNGGEIWIDTGDGNCSDASSSPVTITNNISPLLLQQTPNGNFTNNIASGETAHCVGGVETYDNNPGPNWTNNTVDPNLLSYFSGFNPTNYQFSVTPSVSSPAANYGITAAAYLSAANGETTTSIIQSILDGIEKLLQTLKTDTGV